MKNPNPTEPEHLYRTRTEHEDIFKYSELEHNRTLIIKALEPNTNPKFWVLSHLQFLGKMHNDSIKSWTDNASSTTWSKWEHRWN